MMTESESLLWGLQAATEQPAAFAEALARAKWHVVRHVSTGKTRFGRPEFCVVGRIVLTGDETIAEVEERMRAHGFPPENHIISLDGELVVTP